MQSLDVSSAPRLEDRSRNSAGSQPSPAGLWTAYNGIMWFRRKPAATSFPSLDTSDYLASDGGGRVADNDDSQHESGQMGRVAVGTHPHDVEHDRGDFNSGPEGFVEVRR